MEPVAALRSELKGYLDRLDAHKAATANIAEREQEALAALNEARGEYEAYISGGYAAAVNKAEAAYGRYNEAIESADAEYEELKAARLERRIRQEIYDWAGSIYLSEFGNNKSGTYRTPYRLSSH